MIFRKNSLLFYQSELMYIVFLIICFTLIPTLGLYLSLLYAFPFVVLMLVNFKLHNEYIIINEVGISCQKSGKQLWEYEWHNIAELRKSARYLLPSIEIITFNEHGEVERFALPNHYFQLGKAAREAIKRYYKAA